MTGSTLLVLLAVGWLLGVNLSSGATLDWSGTDALGNVNTNWSDANNWTGGTPAPGNSIYFLNQGTNNTPGVVNNIVDRNTTIALLQYGNTGGFHTTQINAGVGLVVSNTAATTCFVGTATDDGATQTVYATIKGAGTFSVVDTNTASAFVVQQGSANNGSHLATLDLSGLANFNLTAGGLMVGAAAQTAGAYNWLYGTLYLAATNSIRANGGPPALVVGNALSNGGLSYLYLGQSNAIFADSMTVAFAKATATLMFNPSLAGKNPSLVLNGNSNARVSHLNIGDFSSQGGSSSQVAGLMDLSRGTMNVLVDTCYVGFGQPGTGSGSATGTLGLGAGVFNVNTLNVSYVNSTSTGGNVTGTMWLTNGTLVVNGNLLLGFNNGSSVKCSGTLAVTNGTVLANNISAGGGASKVTLSGGLLVVSNTLGSPVAPLTSLTVNQGGTLQFSILNQQTNAAFTNVVSDNSGVINIASMPIPLNYPAQYPLIYFSPGGASGVRFTAGSLPNNYQGIISNDNSSLIWLVVTNGPGLPKTKIWAGAVNNHWDTNTLNWTNNTTLAAYSETDLVTFSDLALTNQINLVGPAPHTPFSWTVTNNVLNYVFTGTNSVGGPANLVKYGSASLTLADGGDSFSGGVTVNDGTMVLDETNAMVTGGLAIAAGATMQVGNNDAGGSLPVGAVNNNGLLAFNQTISNLVSNPIFGSGSLKQTGPGTLMLSAVNGYTGNTTVLQGTLALAGGGSIAGSANVTVSNATLDVSAVPGVTFGGNANLTNGTINVGWMGCNVSSLNLGGASNLMQVMALPPIIFYPTNFTLIRTASGINGNNLALSLPSGSPAYVGILTYTNQAVVLNLTAGPLAGVNATVSFSPTNLGWPLNPSFVGLSYEKAQLANIGYFSSTNTGLIALFNLLGSGVVRIGAGTVDIDNWNGISNCPPITSNEVDLLAGFITNVPNWKVIYGLNFASNNPANCAAEAQYAASKLGSQLLGFEIGNEPDEYSINTIRGSSFTYDDYVNQWNPLKLAIEQYGPLVGPATASFTPGHIEWTTNFAYQEQHIISLATQHYYRGNAALYTNGSPVAMQFMMTLDTTNLPVNVSNIVAMIGPDSLPLGLRMDENGSFVNGGLGGVSDAYGAALWTLDFMFTVALNGGQGVGMHGGGRSPYTPLYDNDAPVVSAVRPEFYGLKIFSLLPHGNVVPAGITLASNINFTAYGVRQTNAAFSVLLNNKDTNVTAVVNVNLGPGVTGAQLIELTGPSLFSTTNYTLGGATINTNGTWAGGVQAVLPSTNGQLTVYVPPISAFLLNPVMAPVNVAYSVTGSQLTLSWPTNYTGWLLQSNSTGLASANWFPVPGSGNTNLVQIMIQPGQGNVFYRLALP